jgi:XTP/dITP diphosphohydrolase
MKELIIATNNQHKLREFSGIFGTEYNLKSLKDINYKNEIIENGSTFIENSLIKCREVYNERKIPVISDDSGLCVEALNGEPGIYSARFGGNGLTDQNRCRLLLEKLNGIENSKASFVCALVLYMNPNRIYIVQEEVRGEIISGMRGDNGFGYDPIFYLKDFNKTMAELSENEKNSISHRGKAVKIMKNILLNIEF